MVIRIGDAGEALSSLHPQGVVCVFGRRYSARADHGTIAPGAAVVVAGGDNLGLVVRAAESTGPPAGLPGYGQQVYASFLDRLTGREERDEAVQTEDRAERRRRGLTWSASAGAVLGAVVLWVAWDPIDALGGPPWAVALTAVLTGVIWGAVSFLQLDWALARFDRGTGRVTAVSTAFALAGGTAGAALGIPMFGLAGGLSLALVGTAALGLALPLLLVLGDDLGQ
jgi:hypothetical protein